MAGLLSAGSAPVTATSADRVVWTFEADQVARTSPTVVDGKLFIGMSDQPSHRLYVLDTADGTELASEFQGRPINEVSVVNDLAFVAQNDGDAAVEVYNATDYERLYSVDMENAPSTQPTVYDGRIYLGSGDNLVYALDAWTGEREWTFETDDSVNSIPLVADGTVYVGCNDDHLYAIDADTGDEEWRFEADGSIRSSPTIADDTVYVGESERLIAVDADDGQLVWEFPLQSATISSSPTVSDGTVFIGDWAGYMYAVDADDGTEQWTRDITEEARASRGTGERVRSSPTVADGTVFIFSDDGYLYALDATTGDVAWRFDTETPIGIINEAPSPTVVDGVVYVANDTTVYALDAGVSGSGSGTRMQYGTRGHHDAWAETAAAADRPSIDEIRQERERGGQSEDDEGESGSSDGNGTAGSGSDTDDDGLPGPGILGALAGISGAGYLLARQSSKEGTKQ